MEHPFLIGERLYLRGIERKDLTGEYFQWLNDYEVTRYLESGRFPNTVEAMEAYYRDKANSAHDAMFMIVLKEKDRPIGTIKLGSINWVHRTAEYGIMVGARDVWNQGYGTEAGRLLLDYAFRRLNLHKVFLGVTGDHEAAIRSYERLGFRQEGRLTEMVYVDGRYEDKVFMGVSREEFYRSTEA
jgi:ribosomal-protein-alanine N-acetyltransferase